MVLMTAFCPPNINSDLNQWIYSNTVNHKMKIALYHQVDHALLLLNKRQNNQFITT